MSVILRQPVTGPAAWRGDEIVGDGSWIHRLSDEAVAAIDAALATVRTTGLPIERMRPGDFPIRGTLAVDLGRWADELENGRGFKLVRGLPADRYTDDELATIHYGLGLHLGIPVRQNPKGDLLGVVAAVGDPNDRNTRVYQTNAYLPYHCDPSDVVGLLCVRKARAGGLSSLVSVAAVYNEILGRHSEYLALYYRLWYFAHLCEDLPSLSPIFSFNEGKLSCRYLRQYIELGHDLRGLPLSRVEIEALDVFDAIIHDERMRLDMMLEPGDMQFANNYAVLHSRTGFEDHEDPALRRKLLRLWLKMPNARRLAPEFPGRNGFPAPVAVPA